MKQLAVSLAVLLVLALQVQADTFHFVIDDFPPYVDRDAEGYGLAPRIISAALASQAHQAEYQFVPWTRAYRMTQEGLADGSFPWSKLNDREKYFSLSVPIFDHQIALVFAPDSARNWQHYDDLTGLSFGQVNGYAIGVDFYDWIERTGQPLEIVNSEALLFRMLAYGRFDAAAFDQRAASGYIEALKDEVPHAANVTIGSRAIEVGESFVLMPLNSPRTEQLQAILAAGMASIRSDGTYAAILESDLSSAD